MKTRPPITRSSQVHCRLQVAGCRLRRLARPNRSRNGPVFPAQRRGSQGGVEQGSGRRAENQENNSQEKSGAFGARWASTRLRHGRSATFHCRRGPLGLIGLRNASAFLPDMFAQRLAFKDTIVPLPARVGTLSTAFVSTPLSGPRARAGPRSWWEHFR